MNKELEKEVISRLVDNIDTIGKKFVDIPKSSVLAYLRGVGINASDSEYIYCKLQEIYLKKNIKPSTIPTTKPKVMRKNLFGEIKRIV